MEQQTNRSSEFEKNDIESNKTMALLAYIIFFIPLLAAKDSKYARYHANQGLILLLAAIAINIIGSIIPIIGWFIIIPLGDVAVFVLAIIGIINASKGEAKPLPVIGSITIIK